MCASIIRLTILAFTTIVIVGTQNITWDSYKFGLTWPPTYCYSYIRPIPDGVTSFTIHGLWPEIYPDIIPNCTAEEKFNLTLLNPLRPELNHKWPHLNNLSATEIFWEREFEKHGQCAVQDPLIRSVFGYFKTALELYNRTDLFSTLRRYNIVPSNQTIYNSYKNYSLEEVRFCMNRSFAYINCSSYGICPEEFYFKPFFNSSELINVTRRPRWRPTKKPVTRRTRI
ncbi:unnamed protein product [Schistosoma turkestanicum]|nr:unnamed protein product [Schistosoma turkestanicum]